MNEWRTELSKNRSDHEISNTDLLKQINVAVFRVLQQQKQCCIYMLRGVITMRTNNAAVK